MKFLGLASVGLVSQILAVPVLAQTFTVLRDFAGTNGAYPQAGLTISGRTLYGTTELGGSYGVIFRVNTDGTEFAPLHYFSGHPSEGSQPLAGVTLAGDLLFGTTSLGGAAFSGTLFRLTTNGTDFAVLRDFSLPVDDGNSYTNFGGAYPEAVLMEGSGTLYGVTGNGGAYGNGSVFKMGTNGTGFTVLKDFPARDRFSGTNTDGANPNALVLSGSTLYGTTASGGSFDTGLVFRMNTDGTGFAVLRNFEAFVSGDAAHPNGGLLLVGGTLYGTTVNGGAGTFGTVFRINTNGTGYSVLKNFAFSDGASPGTSLAMAGSMLFGTTSGGGWGGGTVFGLRSNGMEHAVLKYFPPAIRNLGTDTYTNSDGARPQAGVLLSEGALYGTTYWGGGSGYGTVFKLDLTVPLQINRVGEKVVVSWTNSVLPFRLQSATEVTDAFADIPDAVSPYTNVITGSQQYFRLIAN